MSAYISRKALLEYAATLEGFSENKVYEKGMNIVLHDYLPQIVNDVPDADVQEVKHGKWNDTHNELMPTHKNDEFTSPDQIFYATCSLCGITTNNEGCLNGYRFCPYCGAKMDLKE